MAQTIAITTGEGHRFDAAMALPPQSGLVPALIFVPSIYGNTEGMQATLERYASSGYIVISIDPFWRTVPGPMGLDRQPEASARKDSWVIEHGLADVRAVLAHLQTMSQWNHRFAVVGYCFGGRLAMLGLTKLGADAAVAFHGTGMHLELADAASISKPYSFHFGENDPVVPLEQVESVKAALAGKDGEIFVYPGAAHSFAQQESPRYDPIAGPLSEERALALLERLKA